MRFEGKPYENPTEGPHDAVLADVQNLGEVALTYEGRTNVNHMVRFVYFLADRNSEGQQFRIREDFTVKFGKKAKLPKRLKNFGITSRGFNSEDLVGKTGTLYVILDEKESGTFANVQKFTPKPGLNVSVPADFVRAPENPADNQEEEAA